jgi:hypothetical protein
MDVRAAILKEMKKQKMTRYRLAKKAGMRMGTVYQYLNAENDMTGENVGKLMDALGLVIRPKSIR